MNNSDQRKYFIVKHGLDALTALPNYIWRTGTTEEPRAFERVNIGDRWIAFAYTTSDQRERPLSLITGFYECTRTSRYGNIPAQALETSRGETKAWLIEGENVGDKLRHDVNVPTIDNLLGRPTFKGQTFIPIKEEDFVSIQERVLKWTVMQARKPRSLITSARNRKPKS